MTSAPNREIGSGMIGSLQHSSGSYELVLGSVLAGLVGFGIDSVAGTRPVFTFILAGAGLVGAATSIIYGYRLSMASAEAERLDRRTGRDSTS
jgi:hypothetical protein